MGNSATKVRFRFSNLVTGDKRYVSVPICSSIHRLTAVHGDAFVKAKYCELLAAERAITGSPIAAYGNAENYFTWAIKGNAVKSCYKQICIDDNKRWVIEVQAVE